MSKKRSVAYIKPQEPSFLTKLKQEAGYIEGPTVDTKRESLPQLNDEDFQDRDEDQPTVVVLNQGDLTAEEADLIKKEKESAPADLNERIVFKKPAKDKNTNGESNSTTSLSSSESKKRLSSDIGSNTKSKKSKKKSSSSSSSKLLSFDAEDEEES